MLGELFASQLDRAIQTEVLRAGDERRSIVGAASVGQFLRERVFAAGKRYHWSELVEQATGEPLNPEWFAAQYVLQRS